MSEDGSPPSGSETAVALVFAGGDPSPADLVDHLPDAALVVAADSGLEHAVALGYHVDLVVGDLDSVDGTALEAAVAAGTVVERHAAEKEATDLDLALAACRTRGVTVATVVGGHGGRLDHLLANVMMLGAPRFASLQLDAWMGTARVRVVRDGELARVAGEPGSLCSLLAVDGPARGVITEGMRYPLRGEVLMPGSSRGVSNELSMPVATVSLVTGTLLVVQPFALTGSKEKG
jgi:thiamine pyrophosphokinase